MRFKAYITESKMKWKKTSKETIASDNWEIDSHYEEGGDVIRSGPRKGRAKGTRYNRLFYKGKLFQRRRFPSVSDLKIVANKIQDIMDSQNINDPKKAMEWYKANK